MAAALRPSTRSLTKPKKGQTFLAAIVVAATLLLAGCDLWSPSPARLPNSGDMAVGETRTAHNVSTYCGVRVLGITVAGIQWVAYDLEEDGVAPIPDSWAEQVDESQRIDLEIELVTSEKLIATAVGTDESLHYAPTTDFAVCD